MKSLNLLFPLALIAFAQTNRPVETFSTKDGQLKVTPIRHASMMIEAGGQVFHIDPWSQGNYQGLPQADVIDHRYSRRPYGSENSADGTQGFHCRYCA
jgi:hypothetical protein